MREDEIMVEDAIKLVQEANKKGVYLRLLGAIGIRINAFRHEDLFVKLNRLNSKRKFTDIDLAAYSSQRSEVRKILEEHGCKVDPHFLLLHGTSRMLSYNSEKNYTVDVFFDKLQFSHDVSFGSNPKNGRLNLNPLTLSPTDLALEKLQIHEINEKDIKDLILLFTANAVGDRDFDNMINGKYIAQVLADDWEFWYDVNINLKKISSFLEKYVNDKLIDSNVRNFVYEKIETLKNLIDEEPKTKKWEKRNKVGPNKKWWRDVEIRIR
ncbi:MAG: hypothetical protein QXQ94_11110 [Candidatus Bathyarchaeia archaeon]